MKSSMQINSKNLGFASKYRAISTRDTRFDGLFYTAVLSTKIYCKPSCPARKPKESNVIFLPSIAAAQEQGFRACKRCFPSFTTSPESTQHSEIGQRMLSMITEGEYEESKLEGFADALGYSARQLHRIALNEFGASVDAIARSMRLQNAVVLLKNTNLKIEDICFSTGFSSVRQFNENIRRFLDMTPSEIRKTGVIKNVNTNVMVKLPFEQPYSNNIFRFLMQREISSIEAATETSYERNVALKHGKGWFKANLRGNCISCNIKLDSMKDFSEAIRRLSSLFDVNSDAKIIDQDLAKHPVFTKVVSETQGLKVPGIFDPTEAVFRAIIGQQITVTQATKMLNKLALLGEHATFSDQLPSYFPTAETIAAKGSEILTGPRARINAILTFAEKVASGEIYLHHDMTLQELTETIGTIKGIGAWTCAYIAFRLNNSPDIFIPNDAGIKNGWAILTGNSKPNYQEIEKAFKDFSPWRSYAVMHTWNALI